MTEPATEPGRALRPVFLERQSYRRRRLMDAARLLPLLGILLFVIPLLWPVPDPDVPGGDGVPMSSAMIYMFAAWAAMIVVIALFGLSSRRWSRNDSPHGPGQG